MAAANDISDNERRNRFRAIEFHKGQAKQEILLSLIRKQNAGERTAAYALMLVDPESVPQTPAIKQAIENSLIALKGEPEYIYLVARFQLKHTATELVSISMDTTATGEMREERSAGRRVGKAGVSQCRISQSPYN